MTDLEQSTVEILNQLHATERRSLVSRLGEMSNFISWASADDAEVVKTMVADEDEHLDWLMQSIAEHGGGLWPSAADVHSANLHYLDLDSLMPQVIASVESLLSLYRNASTRTQQLTPAAVGLIQRIGERHQKHLKQLQDVYRHTTPT